MTLHKLHNRSWQVVCSRHTPDTAQQSMFWFPHQQTNDYMQHGIAVMFMGHGRSCLPAATCNTADFTGFQLFLSFVAKHTSVYH